MYQRLGGTSVCMRWREEISPGTRIFCFWQLCPSFEGHWGPVEDASITAQESGGKCWIWRMRPDKAGVVDQISLWSATGPLLISRRRNVKIGSPGKPGEANSSPSSSPAYTYNFEEATIRTKSHFRENTLTLLPKRARVFSEKAQRTCITIGPLGLGFQVPDKDLFF